MTKDATDELVAAAQVLADKYQTAEWTGEDLTLEDWAPILMALEALELERGRH